MGAHPGGAVVSRRALTASCAEFAGGREVTDGPGQLHLASLLSEGFPPSVSLAVVERGGTVLQAFGGYACVTGEPVPTTLETCLRPRFIDQSGLHCHFGTARRRARVPRPRRPGDQVAPSVPARKHHFAAPFHPHSRPGRPPALLLRACGAETRSRRPFTRRPEGAAPGMT